VAQPGLERGAPERLARSLAPLAPLAPLASVRVFERTPASPADIGRRLFRTRPEQWFASRGLARALRAALAGGTFDLVHLDEPCLVRALPPSARERGATPIVVHHHRLDRELAAALPGGRRRALERWRLARLEALAARRHREHLVCCAEDAARLRARHPQLALGVVENGFDPDRFRPLGAARERERLLFLGTLSYGPNVDGLVWFAREVLPALRARRPGLALDVVGRDPLPAVRALAGPGLCVVGGVDDVRPWLSRAAMLVAPLRVGGGTRLKLVEALAMGTPVVATPVAAEGLALADRRHLDLAATPGELAARTAAALDDPGAALARAERGRAQVHARYTWPRLARRVVEHWSTAAERTRSLGAGRERRVIQTPG
jgi:glycosyltransferase involved in cell wall biosynthesis